MTILDDAAKAIGDIPALRTRDQARAVLEVVAKWLDKEVTSHQTNAHMDNAYQYHNPRIETLRRMAEICRGRG